MSTIETLKLLMQKKKKYNLCERPFRLDSQMALTL